MRKRRMLAALDVAATALKGDAFHRTLAGVGSTLPAASTARMSTTCLPGLSRFSLSGEVHGLDGFLSTWHWNCGPASSDVNLIVARTFAEFLGFFLDHGVRRHDVRGRDAEGRERRQPAASRAGGVIHDVELPGAVGAGPVEGGHRGRSGVDGCGWVEEVRSVVVGGPGRTR